MNALELAGPQPTLAAVFRTHAEALLMVAASTLVGLAIAPRWGNSAVDLLYLPAVLGAAVLGGLRPALLAALASALAYNYFFTVPHFTFRIARPADVVTVIVLFGVALVTSHLAAAIRRQSRIAAAFATRNSTIAGLARRLLSCLDQREIADVATAELAHLFDCNAVLVSGLPAPGVVGSAPGEARLTPSDLAVAALTLSTGEAAGRGVTRAQPIEWQFHAVQSPSRILGAIGLARDDGRPAVAAEQGPLLLNLLDQVALALERERVEGEAREANALRERDRLRSALLSSVGHDLRTPLTAIMGAASELKRGPAGNEPWADTISSEAEKLHRYITNLLDMARIESGAVRVKPEPVDLVDAVAAALKDVGPGERATVDLPADLPLVRVDPQLLHHCLINLLDNAVRHSHQGSAINVFGRTAHGIVWLGVEDDGPGLPKVDGRPLDVFRTIGGSDRTGGSGLGLGIVKAFAEAMGIEVSAADRGTARGARFTLRFPAALVIEEVGADAD